MEEVNHIRKRIWLQCVQQSVFMQTIPIDKTNGSLRCCTEKPRGFINRTFICHNCIFTTTYIVAYNVAWRSNKKCFGLVIYRCRYSSISRTTLKVHRQDRLHGLHFISLIINNKGQFGILQQQQSTTTHSLHDTMLELRKISSAVFYQKIVIRHWRRQGGGAGGLAPPMAGQDFFVKIEELLEPVVLNLSFTVRSNAMFTSDRRY